MYDYKIRMSYNDDSQDIVIDGDDLVYAYYAFINESRIILPNGYALRGKDIIQISPDLVACMGWNKGYSPTPEEWGYINKQLGNKPTHFAQEQKMLAEDITRSGRVDLLGNPKARELLVQPEDNKLNSLPDIKSLIKKF